MRSWKISVHRADASLEVLVSINPKLGGTVSNDKGQARSTAAGSFCGAAVFGEFDAMTESSDLAPFFCRRPS